MFGMRYAVDAVFLDERQRVVRALPDFAPGRVSPHVRDAESVLELPAGTVERAGLAEGTQVVIEGEPVAPLTGRGGRLGTALCNLALAALYALFVAAHVSRARDGGRRLGRPPRDHRPDDDPGRPVRGAPPEYRHLRPAPRLGARHRGDLPPPAAPSRRYARRARLARRADPGGRGFGGGSGRALPR